MSIMRWEFEEWATENGYNITPTHSGMYHDLLTQAAWDGWKGLCKLGSPYKSESNDVRGAESVPVDMARVEVSAGNWRSSKLLTIAGALSSRLCEPARLAEQAWSEVRVKLEAPHSQEGE